MQPVLATIGAPLVVVNGVFAPKSKDRKRIVPVSTADSVDEKQGRPNRSWSELLKRFFSIEIMACAACGAKMRFVSHIEEPVVVTRILGHLGLATEAPQLFPPRAPPQVVMFEPPTKYDESYQPSFD